MNSSIVNAVAGNRVLPLTVGIAGAVGLYNAGATLAGWGEEPLTATEKVGTAISHGVIFGATALLVKRAAPRTIVTAAMVGSMTGNLGSALLRGDHPDAPRPRPGNAWSDVTGRIGRDAVDLARRNAIIGGIAGLGVGVVAGRLLTGSWLGGTRIALMLGGAGAGVGGVSGALDGAWRGFYDGTGIAVGRAIDAIDART